MSKGLGEHLQQQGAQNRSSRVFRFQPVQAPGEIRRQSRELVKAKCLPNTQRSRPSVESATFIR